ncbi:hypothetical protein JW948_19185 [bacterium]|nr:hypothetical protein [bacterium]
MKKSDWIYLAIVAGVMQAPARDFSAPQLQRLPIGFTVSGRSGQGPHFIARTGQVRLMFDQSGFSMKQHRLADPERMRRSGAGPDRKDQAGTVIRRTRADGETRSVQVRFVGAHQAAAEAEQLLPWKSHYFIGNDPSKWQTDVPNYARLRYRNIYDGIDLVYYGHQNGLKYDFIIAPGRDTDQIRIRYSGADRMRLNDRGELELVTDAGTLTEKKPVAYQMNQGRRVEIDVFYVLEGSTVSFGTGPYDTGSELIIDPEIVFSSTIGGQGEDYISGSALDAEGNIVITGNTSSEDLPVSSDALDGTPGSPSDAFVLVLDPSGSEIRYMTYFGGSGGQDYISPPAVDENGRLFFAVNEASPDLPMTHNLSGIDPSDEIDPDRVFAVSLSAGGNRILYASYLGHGSVRGVCVNGSGELYFTGTADRERFPLTLPPAEAPWTSGVLAGLLSPDGSRIMESLLIGPGDGIAVEQDAQQHVFVCGICDSDDFPVTPNAFQTERSGLADIFCARLSPDLASVQAATYIGGSERDVVTDMIIGPDVYLCGWSESPDFPVTDGAYDVTHHAAGQDGFFLKCNAELNGLGFCSFNNETYENRINGMAVSPGGLFLAGVYDGQDSDVSPYPPENAFLKVFDPAGRNLRHRWNFGGGTSDSGKDVLLDDLGNAFLTGITDSDDFPTTGFNFGWYFDIFVVKIGGFSVQIPANIAFIKPGQAGTVWKQGETVPIQWASSGLTGQSVRIEIYRLDTLKQVIASETENDGYKTWQVSSRLGPGGQYRLRIVSLLNPSLDAFSVPFSIETGTVPVLRERTVPCISQVVKPVMDGSLDDPLWHFIDPETLSVGGVPGDYGKPWTDWQDHTVTWRAAWCHETNRLYVAVHVEDDIAGRPDNSAYNSPEQEDCIEFYTDGNFDGGDYWENFDTAQRWFVRKDNLQYLYNYPDLDSYPEPFSLANPAFRCTVNDAGDGSWTCEAEFLIYDRFPDIPKSLEKGDRIGWDIWYNDSDNENKSGSTYVIDRQSGWNYAGKAWRNADYFGSLALGDLVDIPYVAMAYPDSTVQQFNKNEIVEIVWESSAVSGPEVSLMLMDGDAMSASIADSALNDGSYLWMVHDSIPSGAAYRIRVASLQFDFVSSLSESFQVTDAPGFHVISPSGDSLCWQTGSVMNVQWISAGETGDVALSLTRNGTPVLTLSDSTGNDGQFEWAIPVWLPSDNRYRIEIASRSDAGIRGQSRYAFCVQQMPAVQVLRPESGASYTFQDSVLIEWETFGPVGPRARIDLYEGDWYLMTIADSASMDAPYRWGIPNTLEPGHDFRIRVGDAGDGRISAFSSGQFTLSDESVVKTRPLPVRHRLLPCQPNPFNPVTLIRYETASGTRVRIRIYNIVGRTVCTLADCFMEAGAHRIPWTGRNDRGLMVDSGIYIVECVLGNDVYRQKVMLVR